MNTNFLDNLKNVQLFKNFPSFYGTGSFITTFAIART
jgi:hypothetical protein